MLPLRYIAHKEKIVLALFVTLFVAVVLRSAWLSDDAYITFRTVDNFINGYGLTWNIAERVQTYTHPLWMFLLSGVYFFTREIYFSSIFLSVIISLFAVLLLVFGIARSVETAVFGILLLIFSKAFIDYSTSGLENPLTHLILAVFLLIYLKSTEITSIKLFLLSLIASFAALNRIDVLLIFIPVLIYCLWKYHKVAGIFIVLAGFLPLILWELFSVFYYGFLFPNTAYAKLNTGIDRATLIPYGFYYLLNSVYWDPLTLSLIFIGLILPFLTKQWRYLPIVGGMALYLLYIISIGGDFMSGRFLTVLFFASVILLANSRWSRLKSMYLPAFVFGIILAGMVINYHYAPLLSTAEYGLHHNLHSSNVEDGRGVYFQASGLLQANRGVEFPDHPWVDQGRVARLDAPCIMQKGGIGYAGFFAGPNVHVLDVLALGDPLLARLPVTYPYWSIGHFNRQIPHGYLETIAAGENEITNKNLAAYYNKLLLITRGDLFSPDRLLAIWNINLGKYNYLVENYNSLFPVNLSSVHDPDYARIWNLTDNLEHYNGVQISLDEKQYAEQLELKLSPSLMPSSPQSSTQVKLCQRNGSDNNVQTDNKFVDFQFVYLDRTSPILRQAVPLPVTVSETNLTKTIDIPSEAVRQGYTQIKIFSDGRYLDGAIYNIEQIRLVED